MATIFLPVARGHAAELSPVGRWLTIDDKTGSPSSVVEIMPGENGLEGKIAKVIPRPGDPPVLLCDRCSGAEKNEPVLGMTILKGLKSDDDVWDGGTILDPDSGSSYNCKMRLTDDGKKLLVRGYIGLSMFGRTQTWIRQN